MDKVKVEKKNIGIDGISYKSKPVSNIFNKLKTHVYDQQAERLKERLELREYLDEKFNEEMGE